MPDSRAHDGQETRNRQFYRSIGGKDAEYNEWAVTVLFYAAVHRINSFLADNGQHPSNHDERERALRGLRRTRAATTHRELRSAARLARYECTQFPPSQVAHYQQLALTQLATELSRPDPAAT